MNYDTWKASDSFEGTSSDEEEIPPTMRAPVSQIPETLQSPTCEGDCDICF